MGPRVIDGNRVVGGRWKGAVGDQDQRGGDDSVNRFIKSKGRETAMERYWTRRERGRGRGVGQERGRKTIDPRLWKRTGYGRRGGRAEIFRCKLWWDWLPTPEVRARGGKEPDVCTLCDEGVVGSLWHVLGECCNVRLIEERVDAGRALKEAMLGEGEKQQGGVRWISRWCEAFKVSEAGQWVHPGGEGGTDDVKAGLGFNEWYGKVPEKWLDDWMDEEPDGGVVRWNRGIRLLRKCSEWAVGACRRVWRTAGEEWGRMAKTQRQKEELEAREERRERGRRIRAEAARRKEKLRGKREQGGWDQGVMGENQRKAAESRARREETRIRALANCRRTAKERRFLEWRTWKGGKLREWNREQALKEQAMKKRRGRAAAFMSSSRQGVLSAWLLGQQDSRRMDKREGIGD